MSSVLNRIDNVDATSIKDGIFDINYQIGVLFMNFFKAQAFKAEFIASSLNILSSCGGRCLLRTMLRDKFKHWWLESWRNIPEIQSPPAL